jgi:hypothetical protein
MAWAAVRIVTKREGDWRLIVRRSDAGFFSFVVEHYFAPASEDEGVWPNGFWSPKFEGGYYQTADEAERDACQQIDWLRKNSAPSGSES